MRTSDAHAPTISIRERYRDVVADRWPVTVAPQPDELLSSWLHRIAYANGVAPRAFAQVLGLGAGMWSAALDLGLPDGIANLLCAKTGVVPDQLAAMTLSQDLPRQLLLPLRNNGRRESSTWLQFCPRCLANDEHPYFRRRWRLATTVSCRDHRSGLRDRCTFCRSRIAVFAQSELSPQHFCARCGFDLRRASKVQMSPAAIYANYCIDELYRRKAVVGSAHLGAFIGQLLSIPELVGVHPTYSLPGLSTSLRIRCFEKFASRIRDRILRDDYPVRLSLSAQLTCIKTED